MLKTFRIALFLVPVALLLTASSSPNQADRSVQFMRQLERQYSLTIEWQDVSYPVNTTHGPIRARNLSTRDFNRYARMLFSEFRVYPKEFVAKSGLKRIVLCKNLRFRAQARNAVPEFASDTLYLDCVRGRSSRDYQRAVIHHEFYHLVDFRDDGKLYQDDDWSALNSPNFAYARGGAAVQADSSQSLFIREPGFLTRYSQSGVEEDKAEVYCHMIVNPHVVAKRASNDPVIQLKVAKMKQQLSEFSDSMGASFWSRIANRQRTLARRRASATKTR